ncbi:DUF6318 family protein [uncultured Cellulomonas sp.]|uniref:DUF6318 family protein n=1 Tax=uncultured Cellulomonas sp. TaxID=189682 RepID=UPI00261DA0F0|nr:DUF6318 family protein [uncultured Cellulomonas sp.]
MLPKRSSTFAVAATAIMLGACTVQVPAPASEPASEPAPVVSTTPAAPPAPAMAPPVAPAELERTDDVGAQAAAEYFVTLWSYTMQTGDVAAWDALSDELCQFCLWTRGLALSIRDSGDTFTGGEITPVGTYLHPFDAAAAAYPVDVDFVQAPSLQADATRAAISAGPAHYGTLGVDVARLDEGWKVLEVTSQGESDLGAEPNG